MAKDEKENKDQGNQEENNQGTKSNSDSDNKKEGKKKEDKKFQTIDPCTNKMEKEFDFLTDDQLLDKIHAAYSSFQKHKELSLKERREKIQKVAEILEKNKAKYAQTITLEIGKPIEQSESEIEKCANYCKYYAENMEDFLQSQYCGAHMKDTKKAEITEFPKGVIYFICPFNFPMQQILKPVIPCMAVGNTVIVRVSHSNPQVGLIVQEVMEAAGFTNSEYQNVFTKQGQLELIMSQDEVQGVHFTGSTKAGAKVAQCAGKNIKKCSLELGGSDPFLVLKDADMELAVKLAVDGRIKNCGQSCTSSKRMIVVKECYDKFVEGLMKKVKDIKIGDPRDKENQVGPMARKDLLETALKQVEKGMEQGAKILCGGKKMEGDQFGDGNFMEITVAECDKDNVLAQEEVFAPVFALIKVKDQDEAVEVANDNVYGLGSVVIGQDLENAEKVAMRVESGMTFVNKITTSDPKAPFGGVKDSGYGRDGLKYSLSNFSNTKLLWVAN